MLWASSNTTMLLSSISFDTRLLILGSSMYCGRGGRWKGEEVKVGWECPLSPHLVIVHHHICVGNYVTGEEVRAPALLPAIVPQVSQGVNPCIDFCVGAAPGTAIIITITTKQQQQQRWRCQRMKGPSQGHAGPRAIPVIILEKLAQLHITVGAARFFPPPRGLTSANEAMEGKGKGAVEDVPSCCGTWHQRLPCRCLQ